jgi:hypothetical protein
VTWREKIVVHLLLLVARMLADDPAIAADIKALSNKVSVEAPKVAS